MGRKTPNATKKTSTVAPPDRGEVTSVAVPARPPDQGQSTAVHVPVGNHDLKTLALDLLRDHILSPIDFTKAGNHKFTVQFGGKDYPFEVQVPSAWEMRQWYSVSLVDLRRPDAPIAMMTFPHSATRHKEDGPPKAGEIYEALRRSAGADGVGARFDYCGEGVGKAYFKMCIPSKEGLKTAKGKQPEASTFTIKAGKDSALALIKPTRPAEKRKHYLPPLIIRRLKESAASPKPHAKRMEDARKAGIKASKNAQVALRSKPAPSKDRAPLGALDLSKVVVNQ
ncbi:hypothetical protein D9611_006702 [Ephemerocybe angulata]|uniref:Uncharacterized protein n=1 Tax=Ephemerocybe angulata TaxID=980116 RepID=A0A8H5C9J8_9AGAR|nr:hypothetical protein D9611_006702 [Tulosesus angulatus]